MTGLVGVVPAAAAPMALILGPECQQVGLTVSCSYTTSGESLFSVPAGVTAINVTAVGAAGGAGGGSRGLYVEVAGAGATGSVEEEGSCPPGEAGSNGGGAGGSAYCHAEAGSGGGGGGASDVRTPRPPRAP